MKESENNGREIENYPGIADGSQGTMSFHVVALNALVIVDSIFMIAVFVGLFLTTPGQHSLKNKMECDAGLDVACNLLVFEVVSFIFFLFSSLVAQGLKLAIYLLNTNNVDDAFRAHNNFRVLWLGMIASGSSAVMGFIFLFLSIVNAIQIRLGMLYCDSLYVVWAMAAIFVLFSIVPVIYVSVIF